MRDDLFLDLPESIVNSLGELLGEHNNRYCDCCGQDRRLDIDMDNMLDAILMTNHIFCKSCSVVIKESVNNGTFNSMDTMDIIRQSKMHRLG